jgi:hypothetical protein
MTRKVLGTVVLAFIAGLALFALTRPAGAEDKKATKKAPYVHTVIFTVKKDAPQGAEAELIADCHSMLAKIPSVRELRVGRPAEKSTPRIARKDYSVGLMILFDDADGLAAYDSHELHKKFVNKHIGNVEIEKLMVFDFSNQEK